MSRVCAICGKGTVSGNKVSHSVRRTRRIWAPNLQKVRAVIDGSPKTINICTRCIRSGVVQRIV